MKKIVFLSLMFFTLCCNQAFSETPPTPSITSLVSTSSSITVTIKLNTDTITDGYYIKYFATGNTDAWTRIRIPKPDTVATSYPFLIRGLDSDKEYRVELTAYDGNDESSYTYGIIETNSVSLRVEMVASGTIEVALDEIPSGVETFEVYIGSVPVNLVDGDIPAGTYNIIDGETADADSVVTKSGLANGTYFIRVVLKDGSGENITISDETAFNVEDFGTLFSSEDIEEGCFINSASHAQPGIQSVMALIMAFLLVVVLFRLRYKPGVVALLAVLVFSSMSQAGETSSSVSDNIIGIKAGFFVPSENLQDDVYDSIVPVSLFYERRIGTWLSADVSAGYSKTDGFAVTGSDTQTGVKTELELIPVSTSLNANLDIHPLITLYAGLGVDYWMFNEKSYYGDKDIGVSGWHGKTGVKLLTGDSNFYARGGVLLEVCYSSMDRFGRNDVDLGGWTYGLGVIYCF